MQELNAAYWNERYLHHDTPWDIGAVSPPIQAYIDQLSDRSLKILIPGAGRAHEAAYLKQQGFEQVWVCDWAEAAFVDFRAQAPDFPRSHQLIMDFFKLDIQVDLILEQTFFCALDPAYRQNYVEKCADLLFPGGKLVGLLFASYFPFEGPPFGGNQEEYQILFGESFFIQRMEIAQNSIQPRLGNEIFIELQKK